MRKKKGLKSNPALQSVSVHNIPEEQEAALTEDMILQFGEIEISVEEISEKVKKDYEDSGNEEELKDIKIYVKPEDNKAYYVANGQIEGNIDLA